MDQIAIRADKYFNNKAKFDAMFGEDNICAVDLNAAYVCPKEDKWGMDKDCGEYTQANIRDRFALNTPSDQSTGSKSY